MSNINRRIDLRHQQNTGDVEKIKYFVSRFTTMAIKLP